MGILDEYMKQVEIGDTLDYDIKNDFNNMQVTENEKEEIIKEIKRIKMDPNDMANKFRNEYTDFKESNMDANGLTKISNANMYIKHAYCPNCGKEIINKTPLRINPYTGEKIIRYDCECGFKANMEYEYPRIVITDDNGNEIKAFITK